MRFPYPLDNCECGHYRINHSAETGSGKTACTSCMCPGFSLELLEERKEVKTKA